MTTLLSAGKYRAMRRLADPAGLIDPDYGYPAAYDVLPPRPGLLLTLESFTFAETPRGPQDGNHAGLERGEGQARGR